MVTPMKLPTLVFVGPEGSGKTEAYSYLKSAKAYPPELLLDSEQLDIQTPAEFRAFRRNYPRGIAVAMYAEAAQRYYRLCRRDGQLPVTMDAYVERYNLTELGWTTRPIDQLNPTRVVNEAPVMIYNTGDLRLLHKWLDQFWQYLQVKGNFSHELGDRKIFGRRVPISEDTGITQITDRTAGKAIVTSFPNFEAKDGSDFL